MFWNKKEVEKPIRFLKINNIGYGLYGIEHGTSYPGYQDENMKRVERLAFYKDVIDLEARLNLILDHLKLKYVPESETKEPAKLVEKTEWHEELYRGYIAPYAKAQLDKTLPKKRGRPKKK